MNEVYDRYAGKLSLKVDERRVDPHANDRP